MQTLRGFRLRDSRRVLAVTLLIMVSSLYSNLACGGRESYWSDGSRTMTAVVQYDTASPAVGVHVTAIIADSDVPNGDLRMVTLEPRITNSEGKAIWEHESRGEPRFIGYEVRTEEDGEMLAKMTPELTRRIGLDDTAMIVTLD